MTTHEALVEARNLIERDGWCQWAAADGRGAHCMGGALGRVTQGDPNCTFTETELAAFRALGEATGTKDYGIPGWNDKPGRTKEEVLAAFDRAIQATAPHPADPFPAGTPVSGVEAIDREPVHA
jgi:hypothetical protein